MKGIHVRQIGDKWERNQLKEVVSLHFQTLAVEWAFLLKIYISMQTPAFTTFLLSTGCSRQKANKILSQRCHAGQTAVVPHVAQMLHCLPEKTKPCPGMCRGDLTEWHQLLQQCVWWFTMRAAADQVHEIACYLIGGGEEGERERGVQETLYMKSHLD